LDNKRTTGTAQQYARKKQYARKSQYARKRPGIRYLRAPFNTMLLFRLGQKAYAYCICCRKSGAGSTG